MGHQAEGKTFSAVVMTFNLRRSVFFDCIHAWKHRKERVAEAIRAAKADFIGTQEGLYSMIAELANLLPEYAWIGEGRKGGRVDETNAILYREDRWIPEESGTFWLSGTPERPGSKDWGAFFPRICTWGLFRNTINSLARIGVFNTHLDHVSRLARKKGAELAAGRLKELQRRTGAPAVFMGDLNANPGSSAVKHLSETFGFLPAYELFPGGSDEAGATYHGFLGRFKGSPIDYIFACGNNCFFQNISVDRNRYFGLFPSDHYPVTSTVVWSIAE